MTGRTGLVLLHGAELGAWVWQRVLPLLDHPALPLDLPGRGPHGPARRAVRLQHAVDSVVASVERWDAAERVVVVGHSFSGVLVPAVVAALPGRAAAAVFLAATVPVAGRSWVDLQPLPQRLVLRALLRVRPDGALSPAGDTLRSLCADLDDEARSAVLGRRVPEAPGLLLDRVATAALTVPAHHVVALRDRAAPPTTSAAQAARLGDPVLHEVDAGHLPMLAAPREVAALLDGIAGGVR